MHSFDRQTILSTQMTNPPTDQLNNILNYRSSLSEPKNRSFILSFLKFCLQALNICPHFIKPGQIYIRNLWISYILSCYKQLKMVFCHSVRLFVHLLIRSFVTKWKIPLFLKQLPTSQPEKCPDLPEILPV